jgi:hypothetical protein
MRQITNHLFARMDGIWSGKMIEPKGMQDRYARVNQILVNVFENCLKALESGERFDEALRAFVIAETGNAINEILNAGPGPDNRTEGSQRSKLTLRDASSIHESKY